MAERPIFLPATSGNRLFREIPINFVWNPGMAPSQKKKNIAALHSAASELGFKDLLETSSKSDEAIGKELSAFTLPISIDHKETTIECAFQSSKVFEHGGPYLDLLFAGSREARSDERLRTSGKLVGFEFEGTLYPLNPLTAFYDWLFVNALYRNTKLHDAVLQFKGFTDIEFNPAKSINCQARSVAIFVSLELRDETGSALDSFSVFRNYYGSSTG
jgi:hypothetical protein